MIINARGLDFTNLNERMRLIEGDIELDGVKGQRFIAAGRRGGSITINGTPGNALGAYLDGTRIEVKGNAQDAVGDTMNDGTIIIHGNVGDAAGYAMRGGRIYVKGNAGYRAGVHMKAYQDKVPVMVIGGRTGSFLGEYLAGGIIVVLGLHNDGKRIVHYFPCTGMHSGKVFLRSKCEGVVFPEQVNTAPATKEDLEEIRSYVEDYVRLFGGNAEELLKGPFTVVTPNTSNPYKQLYVTN